MASARDGRMVMMVSNPLFSKMLLTCAETA